MTETIKQRIHDFWERRRMLYEQLLRADRIDEVNKILKYLEQLQKEKNSHHV